MAAPVQRYIGRFSWLHDALVSIAPHLQLSMADDLAVQAPLAHWYLEGLEQREASSVVRSLSM